VKDFLLSLIVKRQKWVKLEEWRRMGKSGSFRGEGTFLCGGRASNKFNGGFGGA